MKHDWEYKKASEVCTVVTDYVANGSFATLRENVQYKNEKDYAVLVRLADHTNNFDREKFVYVDKHAYDFLAKSTLNGGEIIMSNVGSVGKSFICPDLGMPMTLAPNSILIRTTNNPFYYYYFKSNTFLRQLDSITSKTALPKFNKTEFKKLIFPVPPLAVQEQICSLLDKMNRVIEAKKEQLKELDNLAQSIFFDMFGDPVENNRGWKVNSFKELFKMKSGDGLSAKDFVDGEFPVYGGNGISGYHNKSNKSGKYIIIGRVGVYCGNTRFVNDTFWLTDNAFELIFNDNIFDYQWLNSLLNSLNLNQYANQAAQPVISNTGLKDVAIIIPPLSEQQAFTEKIETIEHQKELINQSIREAQTLFDSRMEYYFGE